MRIKQKELIGKEPTVSWNNDERGVIVQVFEDPRCVNIIKRIDGKVAERQCYPLTEAQYKAYVDSADYWIKHERKDGLHANAMANKYKTGLMNIFWKKIRNYLWKQS